MGEIKSKIQEIINQLNKAKSDFDSLIVDVNIISDEIKGWNSYEKYLFEGDNSLSNSIDNLYAALDDIVRLEKMK